MASQASETNGSQAGGRVSEWPLADAGRFNADVIGNGRPVVIRGLIADWPLVKAAADSAEAVRDYLTRFDRGGKAAAFVGPSSIEGRYFYRPEMTGFNFGLRESAVSEIVAKLVEMQGKDELSVYMGSVAVPELLPGMERENPMPLLEGKEGADPRIWIGNRSRIAPHFDESDNVACVVRGRRRFTLFPPEQVANLYVGPIDQTVAGQPTSMVDLADPDHERFPRFQEALKAALVADLEPGDAIYIPALWWHHVEAPGDFNILVNYWWMDKAMDASSGLHALGHGILSIAELPEAQREAWRVMFDHYVFRRNGDPAAHMPEAARGILGKSTPQLRLMIRQFLMRTLNH